MLVLTVLFLSLSPMFQRATVVQMDLTDCAAPTHSILSALSGAPDTVQRDSCAEYVLSSPTVIFRLQAKRSEVLMVPGDVVSFRTGKGKLYLRRDDDDGEVEATVLCMRSARTPCACGISAQAAEPYRTTAVGGQPK